MQGSRNFFVLLFLLCSVAGCADPKTDLANADPTIESRPKKSPPAPAPTPPPPAPSGPLRDLWVWQSGVVTDSTQQATFFAFAATHSIRNIYVECEGLIQSNQARLASFLPLAASKNIGVHCLFGNALWALTANHTYAVKLAQMSAVFKAANPLLLGVHYDVEPHQLAEWNSSQLAVEAQYVNLVQKLNAAVQSSGLRLIMTIPFWWSGSSYDLAINGVTKHLDQWVLDYADIAIMDFRNTTARITPGMDSITHAAQAGRKAIVGVLIEEDTQYSYTSFFSFFFPSAADGEAYMNKVLTESANYFMGVPSMAPAFDGFAVEDYAWYLKASP